VPSFLEAAADRRLLNQRPHPGRQRELVEAISDHHTVIVCAGRRSGKSRTAAGAALHNLLLSPELDAMVQPGEKRYAVSVANSREQARIWIAHALALVKGSPALRGQLVSESADELVFKGNRVMLALPCSARTGRGYAASFVLMDEAAHMYDETEGPAVAARVYAAMSPSLATFGNLGKLVVASTPLGDSNLFAEIYQRAVNLELPGAVAFHGTTKDMNPAVTDDYLRAQELALGADDFRREFEGVFLSGGAAFIEADRVHEVVADRLELPASAGTGWVGSVDPSFARDATALTIVGRDKHDRERLVLGFAGRWLPPTSRRRVLRSREEAAAITDDIIDSVVSVLKRYGLSRVISDQHAPGIVAHEFQKRGISVRFEPWTGTSRTEALQALRARIYGRSIELYDPPDVPLVQELGRLRTRYRAGSSTVEVPRVGQSHGDVALSLAAAVWAFDGDGAMPTQLPSFGGTSRLSELEAERDSGLTYDMRL
jgi:phage terminase large subunit-like protein